MKGCQKVWSYLEMFRLKGWNMGYRNYEKQEWEGNGRNDTYFATQENLPRDKKIRENSLKKEI